MPIPVSDHEIVVVLKDINDTLKQAVVVQERIAVALEKLLADEEAPVPAGVGLDVKPQP